MRRLDHYIWEERESSLLGGKSRFHIQPIGHRGAGTGYDSIEDFATEVNGLYVNSTSESGFFCDEMRFYSSLNDDVKGKPYLEVTREGVRVFGVTREDDLLYKIQVEMDTIIKRKNEALTDLRGTTSP